MVFLATPMLCMTDDSGARAEADRPTPPLTRRERDVLAASARGLGANGVARELGLPAAAVRAALASAIDKLGARSKLEAVVSALRDGLIEAPSDV